MDNEEKQGAGEQASKPFEGTLLTARQPVEAEHYNTIARGTAEALAEEVARRLGQWRDPEQVVLPLVAELLFEWFTGKFRPGHDKEGEG